MSAVSLGLPSPARPRPAVPPPDTSRGLVDTHGRLATDLRVSLTDRCNLRCTYCMPADGLDWMPSEQLLSADEITRLLRIAVSQLGVTSVRFTGGEPLLRRDLVEIVHSTAALDPRPEISLTTNGLALTRRAGALKSAGLDRVNVSLDTIDREHFATITRRDRLDDVLSGLAAAHAAGLRPVKVNAVLSPDGDPDRTAVELLRFCLDHDYELRIIEQMPLDAGHDWRRSRMVTAAQTREALSSRYSLTPVPAPRGSAPAQRWIVDGGPATVGIIASVTEPFCGACNRNRLTADGQVRSCLFSRDETDLRALLRSGVDDALIIAHWRAAAWAKPAGHGIDDPGFVQPERPMSAIGG